MALGMFPRQVYEEQVSTLEPGDLLAMYSDGVSDAQNMAEEDFGVDRLIDVLRDHAAEPPESIVDAVFESIDQFAGEAPQFDDITLMVVKREGTSGV
jgi:sigma-B regulation protein RsbU (phosphoserine phosphatase)